jgi:hypothetical protein
MSTTLRDFIASREAEIREQLKALKAEQKELQVAKAALDGQEPAAASAQSSSPTIKEMALYVLRTEAAKEGMTSHQILAGIKQEFGRDIDRTSLSPQLSRLKTDEEIGLIGEKWFSKERYDAQLRQAEVDELIGWQAPPEQEEDSDIPY